MSPPRTLGILALALVGFVGGCGGPSWDADLPEIPCAAADGAGVVASWTWRGRAWSLCSSEALSYGILDRSYALLGYQNVIVNLGIGTPEEGERVDAAYDFGSLTIWEPEGAGERAPRDGELGPSDRVDDVTSVSITTYEGAPEHPGVWRMWRTGTFGEEFAIEVRDANLGRVEGDPLFLRQLVWRGRLTPDPLVLAPIDPRLLDAGR